MSRRLSLVTQASPEYRSFWNPAKKKLRAIVTYAVRMGHP
jgi:hypothetical protein